MSSDTKNVKDVYTNDLNWCTQPVTFKADSEVLKSHQDQSDYTLDSSVSGNQV